MAVSDIRIRVATADDAGLLLQLIRELAAYERAPNAVVTTEEDLRRYGFGREPQFEATGLSRRRARRSCLIPSQVLDLAALTLRRG